MAKEFKSGDILTAADMNNIVTDLETSKTDINELKSDLGQLSEAIADLENVVGAPNVNLYDASQNEDGGYWKVESVSNRCIKFSYTGWQRTARMPIHSEREYTYSGITVIGNTPVASYFDESGTSMVGGYFKAQTGENQLDNIPSGAKYVSFSVNSVDADTFVFMESETTLREEVDDLQNNMKLMQDAVVFGNLKQLPPASKGRLLIVKTADGGLAYSDTAFWRWAKDNSLAVSARAYQTIRVSDGAIINSYNADTVYNIYSVTKLLSCVVACMYITDYSETVAVRAGDIGSEISSTLVQAGDVATYEALLNAAMIKSDNNAANALRRPVGYLIKPEAATDAEAINAFYGKMGELAESLSMTNTDCDPNRISAAASVRSTAADLCKLLAYTFNNSTKIKEIWNKLTYTMSVTGENARSWTITSTTPETARVLLPEFDGGKTGSSAKMGAYAFCWKDGDNVEYATALLEMTLATGDRFQDARHIMDEVYSLI